MNVERNMVYTLEVCESEFKLIQFSLEKIKGILCDKEDKAMLENMICTMEEKE